MESSTEISGNGHGRHRAKDRVELEGELDSGVSDTVRNPGQDTQEGRCMGDQLRANGYVRGVVKLGHTWRVAGFGEVVFE